MTRCMALSPTRNMKWLTDAIGIVCVTVLAAVGVVPGGHALIFIGGVLGLVALAKVKEGGGPSAGAGGSTSDDALDEVPVTRRVSRPSRAPMRFTLPPSGFELLFNALTSRS